MGQNERCSLDTDVEWVYLFYCEAKLIFQNTIQSMPNDSLFYASVLVQDKVCLRGMLDSGSMATTLSADVVPQLREAGVLDQELFSMSDIVLVWWEAD